MKNKMTDLNNHLFAQLERLGDEDMSTEQLQDEVARADSMVKVADKIIDSANTSIRAAKMVAEHGRALPVVPMLGFSRDD